ncbi:MAG: class I SAM-dependent methyltransferase [Candidatus Marinarcus sp.]|uniref:class I SAM-dependent methyltransferase n=1 Tax=Candidatus Marinarcus sp. TaxID=3100987 RepID=UPI003AFFF1A6
MFEIYEYLYELLKETNVHGIVEFEVLNPDLFDSTYAGNLVTLEGNEYLYRGYKAWMDLAETLFCKILTPKIVSKYHVLLQFKKLDQNISFHHSCLEANEKYGENSEFSRINKNEEPAFLQAYKVALDFAKISEKKRVLNLGINSGDEFALILQMYKNHKNIEFVGVDYCKSAILSAKRKFDFENMKFYAHDINELGQLNLGKFDAIITIGTLQSSSIDFKLTFMSLIQNYLEKNGSIILGFPNCRWLDGEMIYGAKMPNYSFSEMTLLYKDVYFCKKYLQQKQFKVMITGKNYIFLSARSIH